MHYPVREVPDVMTDNQDMSLHSSVPPNLNQTWNVHGAQSHIHYQKYLDELAYVMVSMAHGLQSLLSMSPSEVSY
jgi:hypothetical protein